MCVNVEWRLMLMNFDSGFELFHDQQIRSSLGNRNLLNIVHLNIIHLLILFTMYCLNMENCYCAYIDDEIPENLAYLC